MRKLDDFKFYEGITEDNIKNAKIELEKKNNDVVGFEKLELQNQFILFFNKRDTTIPPHTDLMKPTFQSEAIEDEPKNTMEKIISYAKKYWILSIALGIGIFLIYKG